MTPSALPVKRTPRINQAASRAPADVEVERNAVTLPAAHITNEANRSALLSPGVFRPLAKSDYLMADKARAIRGVIKGQQLS